MPPEVVSLLNYPDGRFLLVKGSAGTGKTMFCLELIRECGGLYVSTRVRAERLYKDSPGLEESVPADFIIDASVELDEGVLRDFVERPGERDGAACPEEGRERGDRRGPEIEGRARARRGEAPQVAGAARQGDEPRVELPIPPLINRILDKTELAQTPFVVVIDSWDAIFSLTRAVSSRRRGPGREEMQTMLLRAFRNRALNLVMVEEGEAESSLDYLVDGIIELRKGTLRDRVIRRMHLRKMRGTEIHHAEYLFTLVGGRFQYFEPFVPKIPARIKRWRPMSDTEARFSSGSEDLDILVGGGFRRGSSVLVDVGPGVPDAALEQLVVQTSANFLAQGRPVMMVLPGGLDAEAVAQRLSRDVGEEAFNSLARVIEKGGGQFPRDKPYMVVMRYENLHQDFGDWMYVYKALRQRSGQPVLQLIGVDTQEARYGEDSYKELLSTSTELIRKEGNLMIRITRPGAESLTTRCANVSDLHMRMEEVNGSVLVSLEKPRSSLYYMDTDAAGGNIRITLKPML
ncbi:MAG: gas vesicle protein GvpD basic region 2 domain-containing protein [Thermoplasmatota archaeon]